MLQCVPKSLHCNGVEDCLNAADEQDCGLSRTRMGASSPPPAIVDFTGTGTFTVRPLVTGHLSDPEADPCPETHFRCPEEEGYCLPVFVRCNKVNDCPGHEDEAGCDVYQCPGFYRCRGSQVCVHPDHMCDDVFHCPQRDDELLCAFSCPKNCVCYGQAFFCTQSAPVHAYSQLRFLEAEGTGMGPVEVRNNAMLIYLGLGTCKLTDVKGLGVLTNLRSLDLRENLLTSLSIQLSSLRSLRWLSLAGNPLSVRLFSDATFQLSASRLRTLDLSRIDVLFINTSAFTVFPDLENLNFSNSGVMRISGDFQLPSLQTLDLRGCPVSEFSPSLLTKLGRLRTLYCDSFKLCCPSALPAGFDLRGCWGPADVVSSCESLLKSQALGVFVSASASLALLGNLACLVLLAVNRQESDLACVVFMKHLCVSDVFMGIYLAIIGVAHRHYEGSYVWNDVTWKTSFTCKAAGFMSLLSSEMSAFIVFFIMLDRLLVIRFPGASRCFDRRFANRACVVLWTAALLLAAVPFSPFAVQWRVYGHSAVCISLPFGDDGVDAFSFSVRIVLNSTLLLLSGVQQVLVRWSLDDTKASLISNRSAGWDHVLARRLLATFTPTAILGGIIGLFGFLSSAGVSTSSEIKAAMGIVLLPLHSVVKPLFYLLAVVQEKRRQERAERVRKTLTAQLHAKQAKAKVNVKAKVTAAASQPRVNSGTAESLLASWLASGLLTADKVRHYLAESGKRVEQL